MTIAEIMTSEFGFVHEGATLLDAMRHLRDCPLVEDEIGIKCIIVLDEREQRILCLRFGLGQPSDQTLEEVGQELGITRERVRQLEARALKKLKEDDRTRGLVKFW